MYLYKINKIIFKIGAFSQPVVIHACINLIGKKEFSSTLKTLLESSQVSGMRSVTWNATDNNDQPVSAGVYLYKIQTRGITKTRKMVFLK